MNELGERELDPLPFLVIGLILLGLGLVMLWRGVGLRRIHRGQAEHVVTSGPTVDGAAPEQDTPDPRPAGRRDPRDWLRIFVEGLLLTGVGLAFTVHAASRLLG
ncbi:hypothetical protein [Catellatospora sichuanensis]|uniref:hypothetical protein n=1 Tax=Catellatospora sichuanensis TaxID=1969805 RepID=UPI001182C280|nr:hypothetical protein [Catellatospora sichuanensis]